MARPIAKPPTKRGRALLDHLEAHGYNLASAARAAFVDKGTLARAVHEDSELHAPSVASLIGPPLMVPIELASPALAKALSALGVLPVVQHAQKNESA